MIALQQVAKAVIAGVTTGVATFTSLQATGGTPVWLEVVAGIGAGIVAGAATWRVPNADTDSTAPDAG